MRFPEHLIREQRSTQSKPTLTDIQIGYIVVINVLP